MSKNIDYYGSFSSFSQMCYSVRYGMIIPDDYSKFKFRLSNKVIRSELFDALGIKYKSTLHYHVVIKDVLSYD